MQIKDEKEISEELSYLHVFVFQDTVDEIEKIIKQSFSNTDYKEALLSSQQKEWLYEAAKYRSFSSIGKEEKRYHNLSDWKIYLFTAHRDDYAYVMPFHNRGDIDVYFGDELKTISRLTQKQIFYFWREHETWGYEIFKNGDKIKSIVEDTHGPRVVVDGQEVFCGITKEGKPRVGQQLIDGKPIEFNEIKEGVYTKYRYNYSYPYKNEPKFFPESVFNYFENTLLENHGHILNPEKKNIIFVHNNIINIDDYINETNKLIKSNRIGCAILFYGALALIALGVLFAILKGK